MKNKNISNSMKLFWKQKNQDDIQRINIKRSNALKTQCVWLKKEGEKPFPCNIEFVLSKLADGFLIVNTEKNKEKVNAFFGEIPYFFWADKNKQTK
jgi:uncharacterized protein YehS (DUF1456 family)